jgi:hypothetical protein
MTGKKMGELACLKALINLILPINDWFGGAEHTSS